VRGIYGCGLLSVLALVYRRYMRVCVCACVCVCVCVCVCIYIYIYIYTVAAAYWYKRVHSLLALLVQKGFMCPHTPTYVSSYCYICVLILLYICPHTAMYVSSYCYMCVLILLYVSSYSYICVLTYADVCWRMLASAAGAEWERYCSVCVWGVCAGTHADVCWRMLTYADVCWRMLTYAMDSVVSACETFAQVLLYYCFTTALLLLYYTSAYVSRSRECVKRFRRCSLYLLYWYLHYWHAAVCWRMLACSNVCWRMLTYADVCWRMLTYADVCYIHSTQTTGSWGYV
jgi:hypothetical protein